ncbi:MAG TPA: amino acid adenylation domain-containing protein, partial [Chitinophaga sp.]|uniref:non-ribosomal peptide synthetase n=1 Tax=Chitinophaga sp. TaxID=1869181 RepID=UPI002DBDCA68
GRADNQVKIHGYRVELEEIENVLIHAPGVLQAAVTLTPPQENGECKLVFYVTGAVDHQQLKDYLGNRLPGYMMPSAIVTLERMPLTSNGKIDKRELSSRAVQGPVSTARQYTGPRNKTEEQLQGIWQDVLETNTPVGMQDNFFELGGHSIKVIKLLSRITKAFGTVLSVQKVFEQPTIEGLAKELDGSAVAVQTAWEGIPRAAAASSYPLSSSQKRLWVLHTINKGSVAYNIANTATLYGVYDANRYEQALRSVVARHEILRTVFREDGGEMVRQCILPASEVEVKLAYADLRDEADPAGMAEHIITEDKKTAFDLTQAPLFRVMLFRIKDGEYLFYYNMHHIISDGWSMNVLAKDILHFYEAGENSNAALPELPIQYKDYAVWEQASLLTEKSRQHRAYWMDQLKGELPALLLPTEKTRPPVLTFNGRRVATTINAALTQNIKALCQSNNATLFMGLLGVLKVLFYRYSGQEDIIIGSPVAGREHADLEGQIGLFINTIALRTQFSGDDSFNAVLDKVKDVTLAAYDHQQYPFDKLVDDLDLRWDYSRSAVFDVMMILHNQRVNGNEALAAEAGMISDEGECQVKFDLQVEFSETGDGLHMEVQFNTAIYDRDNIERLITHYRNLLEAVTAHTATPVARLDYLAEEEQLQLLEGFNDTAMPCPQAKTIVDLFEAQVAETPDRIALVFQDQQLTYHELNARSNQLAHYLLEKGVGKDTLVPVCMDRSPEMVIAIWAVMKAGGAYVPLDPAYPEDRIRYMIEDINAGVILTEHKYEAAFFEDTAAYLVLMDRHQEEIAARPAVKAPVNIDPGSLVYVIYTSGSTGKPKGVMIEHYALLNVLCAFTSLLQLPSDASLLAVTTYSFDIAYIELFLLMLSGGKVILVDRVTASDGYLLSQQLALHQPMLMQATPSTWQMLTSCGWRNDEDVMIMVGGEAVKTHLKDQLVTLSPQKVWNVYGPTEATIWATAKELKLEEKVTIGRPLDNTQLYVLDSCLKPVPIGVTGELYIGGVQLARGYLNRPELTAERFIPHPFKPGERLYRTGDLVRWMQNGDIDYLGRADDQVKVRGYRIETGEVEHALLSLEGINAAVVTAKEDGNGYSLLVAYIVSDEQQDTMLLRQRLLKMLPEYMVPGYYMQLERLPLTANGKVNKKVLPAIIVTGMSDGITYVAPRNDLERGLERIWQEVLRIDTPVSIAVDFFTIGGHSLRVMQLANHYYRHFNARISMQELFQYTTIAAHAELISGRSRTEYAAISRVAEAADYAVSDGQRRLWVLSQEEEGSRAYHLPGELHLDGDYDPLYFEQALHQVIDRHEILRTVFRENAEGELRQQVLPAGASGFRFDYQDFTGQDIATIRSYLAAEFHRSFDLGQGPLLRAGLIKRGADQYIFYYNLHHIISDGWSMNLLGREVLSYYEAYASGVTPQVSALP